MQISWPQIMFFIRAKEDHVANMYQNQFDIEGSRDHHLLPKLCI